MLKAKKANRTIKIPEEKKSEYIALGYSITDMDGNMIHEHVDDSELLKKVQKENATLKEKLEEAEKYAEEADKKIADLEAQVAAKAESEATAEPEEQDKTPAKATKGTTKTTKAAAKASE